MARPYKKGLDYFPLDIDIFENDKLLDVQNDFGPFGEVIYLRILCIIYKHGYYYKFESLNNLAAKLIKSIGNKWVRDKKRVLKVISQLAECNLFSPELMRSGILTSSGVQRRYLKVTGRRRSTNKDYWLLSDKEETEIISEIAEGNSLINAHNNEVIDDNNEVYVCNIPVNVDNNHINKSKVNKSKENEIKENESESKVINYINIIPVDTVENWNNMSNEVNKQYNIIADVRFRIKNKTKHLIFTCQDAEKIQNIFPNVDLKIESARMQNWFDKPEHKNINLNGDSLNNFLNRWLANAHIWGGSKAIEADKDFNIDEFFESIAKREGVKS